MNKNKIFECFFVAAFFVAKKNASVLKMRSKMQALFCVFSRFLKKREPKNAINNARVKILFFYF
jgi:hypothetical protein